ncbi:DUF2867 domain-containing protein [Streptomyces sp. NPDC019396]|uniref:DUF2867 domain-containing protein n=1 Tax=Streptomyces sp. NPDC019396 TaxID=3154687 RepID=UPI0033CA6847
MRLPSTAHTSRPWRIHEIAGDFQLEDVWALPTPGGPDDLHYLVQQITSGTNDKAGVPSPVYRALFAIRWYLGRLLGWDKDRDGIDSRVRTLRDRLPADLREAPRGPDAVSVPFTSVYQLHDEWAAEAANRTVHAVMHIGWVPAEGGGHRGQLAVMVKPNGLFGAVYMACIKPFRYVGVYPALLRAMGREWQETAAERAAGQRG